MKSLLIDNGTAIYEAQRSCNLTGFVAFFKVCSGTHFYCLESSHVKVYSSVINAPRLLSFERLFAAKLSHLRAKFIKVLTFPDKD